jgi:hypothetical protein
MIYNIQRHVEYVYLLHLSQHDWSIRLGIISSNQISKANIECEQASKKDRGTKYKKKYR